MKSDEPEPTRDELLTMAYVDGELDDAARSAFEARLQGDERLAREVAALRRLAVLARHAAGPEPIDHEWERIRGSSARRIGLTFGWMLVTIGAVGLIGWAIVAVSMSALSIVPKVLILALQLACSACFSRPCARACARSLTIRTPR